MTYWSRSYLRQSGLQNLPRAARGFVNLEFQAGQADRQETVLADQEPDGAVAGSCFQSGKMNSSRRLRTSSRNGKAAGCRSHNRPSKIKAPQPLPRVADRCSEGCKRRADPVRSQTGLRPTRGHQQAPEKTRPRICHRSGCRATYLQGIATAQST